MTQQHHGDAHVTADFPRVLFVTPCAFNKITGGGITFSNLFKGWPKDRLATVTSDPVPVSLDVCERYFFLGQDELDYVAPFSRLLPRARAGGADPAQAAPGLAAKTPWWIATGKRLVGEAGIPDRGRLTPPLAAFASEFAPQVIYTICGSPGYIDLIESLCNATGAALAVHLMDDGVTAPRRKGLFGPYLSQVYGRKFSRLMRRCDCAMAICEMMAEEYSTRFSRPFAHFQNTLELSSRTDTTQPAGLPGAPPRLVYVGSVLPFAQRDSLAETCQAVRELNEQGFAVKLDIYTPLSLLETPPGSFTVHPNIRLLDAPTDDADFFRILAGADMLLLPVNFDHASVRFIRLSMPTKVPAYLASGTPILVYGPDDTAQVRYALRDGWGEAVTRPDRSLLKDAIRRLAADRELRQRLTLRAAAAMRQNHDADTVRLGFQQALRDVARNTPATGARP